MDPFPIPYSCVAVDVLPFKVLSHTGTRGGLYDAPSFIIVCLNTDYCTCLVMEAANAINVGAALMRLEAIRGAKIWVVFSDNSPVLRSKSINQFGWGGCRVQDDAKMQVMAAGKKIESLGLYPLKIN